MRAWPGFAASPAGLSSKLGVILRDSLRVGSGMASPRARALVRQTLEDKKRFLVRYMLRESLEENNTSAAAVGSAVPAAIQESGRGGGGEEAGAAREGAIHDGLSKVLQTVRDGQVTILFSLVFFLVSFVVGAGVHRCQHAMLGPSCCRIYPASHHLHCFHLV